MRRLAVLLVALATPAWAANDGESAIGQETTWRIWHAQAGLCARLNESSYGVCMIKTAPSEELAIGQAAESLVAFCGPDRSDLCDEVRAYIRRRWASD